MTDDEKVTFIIRKDLKEKLEKYKDRLNWDEEVQRFLEKKIKEIEALDNYYKEYFSSMKYKNALVLSTDKRAIEAYEAGKYVLVCDGQYVGAFNSEKEVFEFLKGKNYQQCIIDHKDIRKYVEEIGELI